VQTSTERQAISICVIFEKFCVLKMIILKTKIGRRESEQVIGWNFEIDISNPVMSRNIGGVHFIILAWTHTNTYSVVRKALFTTFMNEWVHAKNDVLSQIINGVRFYHYIIMSIKRENNPIKKPLLTSVVLSIM
jgi:hypothetical protein